MLLDGLRGNRGQKRDADVDDRRGGEGFKPLERVLGNLLALCGELQKPDRQRKRRILENRQKFRRKGLHDQPEGDG
ncbi:hypothetical protein LCGC14_0402770 [marine sediment metagenome]|uniref:Uncharacterized protein n=1 Tax=marine sediment metagenome TaxID=412755 RepID=A0A0F9T1T3_9ZZZZ